MFILENNKYKFQTLRLASCHHEPKEPYKLIYPKNHVVRNSI